MIPDLVRLQSLRLCTRCAARAAARVAGAAASAGRGELATLPAPHVRKRAGVFERRPGAKLAWELPKVHARLIDPGYTDSGATKA